MCAVGVGSPLFLGLKRARRVVASRAMEVPTRNLQPRCVGLAGQLIHVAVHCHVFGMCSDGRVSSVRNCLCRCFSFPLPRLRPCRA